MVDAPAKYILRLYIVGQTPKSVAALENLKKICEDHLQGQYEIETVDLLQNPSRARNDQILAIPTLVRSLPSPVVHLIGDLSDTQKVLVGLEVKPQDPAQA